MDQTAGRDKRRSNRNSMLKRAQIVSGTSLFDCHIIDSNDTGVRVRTASPLPLPEKLILRLPDGLALAVERRWSSGTEVGLEFVPDGRNDAVVAARAQAIYAVLAGGRVTDAVRELSESRFFGDPLLRRAAFEVEAARARLADILQSFAVVRTPH